MSTFAWIGLVSSVLVVLSVVSWLAVGNVRLRREKRACRGYCDELFQQVRLLMDERSQDRKIIHRLEQALQHDTLLPGLYNRKGLESHFTRMMAKVRRLWEEADRHNRRIRVGGASLLILDLDGFKAVNDRHGHAKGDDILRTVAGVLNSFIRDNDCAARLGGDEFAVLLPNIDLSITIRRVGGLMGVLRSHPLLCEHGVTASIGITDILCTAEDVLHAGTVWQEALKRADAAMYLAKERGKNMTYVIMHGGHHLPTISDSVLDLEAYRNGG